MSTFVHPSIVREKDREIETLRYVMNEQTKELKKYREKVAELTMILNGYKAQKDYVDSTG